MPAIVAMATHEAAREVAAREVALKGIHHIARQGRGVGRFRVGEKRCQVLADKTMEKATRPGEPV